LAVDVWWVPTNQIDGAVLYILLSGKENKAYDVTVLL
jgi:hypothetical protein